MTESTNPDCQLVVTPVSSTDPYSVTFNVKAPNKDCYGFRYLMNYMSEWESAYYDDETMFSMYGVDIKDASVYNLVNSDEGYNLVFGSWENTESKILIAGYNVDEALSGIQESRNTSAMETGTPLQSDLFDKILAFFIMIKGFLSGSLIIVAYAAQCLLKDQGIKMMEYK